MLKKFVVALALCAGLGTAGQAATFYSFATNGNAGCMVTNSGSSGTSATCAPAASGQFAGNGAFAASDAGTLRVGAQSFAARDASGTLQVLPTGSNAQATFSDTLFFSQNAGVYRMTVDLLGSLSLFAPDLGNPSTIQSSVSFDASGGGVLHEIDAANQDGVGFGGPQISVDRTQSVDRVETFDFTYTGGQLNLFVSLQAQTRCSGAIATVCVAESAFLNSLRIIGGEVLDTNGNVNNAGFIGSDSGFNYIAGVDPHDRGTPGGGGGTPQPAPVPLPAAGWMLLAGLFGLGALRGRA